MISSMTTERAETQDAVVTPDEAVDAASSPRLAAAPPPADPDDHPAFQLALPIFQGPLDLLLHLIEREELDITNIALVQVADQYMAYIRSTEQINLDVLADFIYIGARLLLLKSRALLPRPPAGVEPLSEYEDPTEDLALQLREYKLFKEAAGQLRVIEQAGLHSYPRIAAPPEMPPSLGLDGITLDLLREMVEEALTRVPEEAPPPIIRPHRITVREKIVYIREQLMERGQLSFRALMLECGSRMEIIVSFMAVLELMKSRTLDAVQDASFADIVLVKVEDEEAVGVIG
jgi:segregation and condensation protein A